MAAPAFSWSGRCPQVVQIGVADPAGLDVDDGLPRAGIGHRDRLDADRGPLAAGNDALNLI
jgi:hypothetical protein